MNFEKDSLAATAASLIQGMITNPENLSKDRLKAELKKKGIRFNNNENKIYYVDLYRSKVMSVEPGFKGGRGEFSSDDEIRQSPKAPKKQVQRLPA